MDTKIVALLVFTIILGGTAGFGLSYVVFNEQIQTLKSELSDTMRARLLYEQITLLRSRCINVQVFR